MRVIKLEAENFKKLRAVSISPTGNLVEVSGPNASGKSSTLDAIWAALGGKDAAPAKPIRDGEDTAFVSLDLGDSEVRLKVTRKFRLKEGAPYATDLIVESGDGARFPSPQSILDSLVGALCFDPLAFTRMKAADQLAALRKFVPDVDFEHLEGLNRRDFDERTEVNRKAKELRAQAEALPSTDQALPERADLGALEATLADAAEHNTMVEQRRVRRENTQRRLEVVRGQIADLQAEEAQLAAQLAGAGPLPELIDVQEARQRLTEARESNGLIERVQQRQALELRAKDAEERAAELTQAIEKRKEEAAKVVAAAKMPVKGLGFGDGFVTLDGQPFDQASHAQQIRASVAIAAALNPRLRVAIIHDASLLDRRSWAALAEYAHENDMQIWAETIETKGTGAVHIFDGGVASIDEPEPAHEIGDVV